MDGRIQRRDLLITEYSDQTPQNFEVSRIDGRQFDGVARQGLNVIRTGKCVRQVQQRGDGGILRLRIVKPLHESMDDGKKLAGLQNIRLFGPQCGVV